MDLKASKEMKKDKKDKSVSLIAKKAACVDKKLTTKKVKIEHVQLQSNDAEASVVDEDLMHVEKELWSDDEEFDDQEESTQQQVEESVLNNIEVDIACYSNVYYCIVSCYYFISGKKGLGRKRKDLG